MTGNESVAEPVTSQKMRLLGTPGGGLANVGLSPRRKTTISVAPPMSSNAFSTSFSVKSSRNR